MPSIADIGSMIVDVRCYIESTAAHFKSRWGAILAGVYLLPGAWIIVSTYRCRSMFCDLPAIVYSALPVPFLKLFYIAGAVLQGVSWWQAAWPMPGAILAALSLVCNAGTIYFIVLLIGKVFRRKVASQA